MNYAMLRNAWIIPILLIFVALGQQACQDDNDRLDTPLMEALEGTWDITSYNLAGTEYIGILVESAAIRFETIEGLNGTFTQEMYFEDEAEPASITGGFSVDDKRDRIRLNYDGSVIVAGLSIEGDELTWESIQDGFPLDLKATKRP